MKFLLSLLFIFLATTVVSVFLSKRLNHKKNYKHRNRNIIGLTVGILGILLAILGFAMYEAAVSPDMQCLTKHATRTSPPISLLTFQDYFTKGNYDYDTGDCKQAIQDYTKSILLNPTYAQGYNNRAYTYMRMHQYELALKDLNMAISLNPLYVRALMNRGDIYNYYFAQDTNKAIADYTKVIQLGAKEQTSVCGHKGMAEANHILPIAFFRFLLHKDC